MKKRNLMALLLATAMCVGVLAGCGSEGETEKEQVSSEVKESSSEKPAESSTQEVEAEKEPVNIVWARYGSTTSGPYETAHKEVEEALNEYLAENYGVTVTMINYPAADYSKQMSLELAAGADIDVITCGTGIWNPYTLYTNGSAMEITELLETTPTLYESVGADIWETIKFDGGLYCIPSIKEMGTGVSYMINNKFIDKYGWDVSGIKEWEDFEPFLDELAKDDECAYAFWPRQYLEVCYDDIANVNGYIGVLKNGDTTKIINIYETEEFMEYCKRQVKWAEAGYWPEDMMINSQNYQTLRNQGQYGMQPMVSIPGCEAETERRYTAPCTEIVMSSNWLDSNSAIGSAYCINSESEKAEAAIKFIEALETDMIVGDLAVYGIEGKHYTREADNSVTKIADSGYSFDTWTTTTVYNCSRLSTEPENKYELYEEFNAKAKISPLAGFRFDRSAVEAEHAACQEVFMSYYQLFQFGEVDPEVEVPNFNKALKDAGIDKVIAEAQAQYDAFLAAK